MGGREFAAVAEPAITVKVPDVTGDNRPLAGLSLENFAGNVRIPRANSAPPASRRPARCAPVRTTDCP